MNQPTPNTAAPAHDDNQLIAERLGIGEKTVKTHVSSILSKLGLTDRTQAALYAVRAGLIES